VIKDFRFFLLAEHIYSILRAEERSFQFIVIESTERGSADTTDAKP